MASFRSFVARDHSMISARVRRHPTQRSASPSRAQIPTQGLGISGKGWRVMISQIKPIGAFGKRAPLIL